MVRGEGKQTEERRRFQGHWSKRPGPRSKRRRRRLAHMLNTSREDGQSPESDV